MGEAAIRVLLMHECPLVCATFRQLLESQPDLVVVGAVPPSVEGLHRARSLSADLILVDPIRQGERCLDLIPLLAETAEHPRVVVLTREPDREFEQRAVQLGAQGIVDREQSPAVLFKALRKVHAGEVWLERELIARVLLTARHAPPADPELRKIATLTPREREVIALLGEGLDNREIAVRLSLSEATVRHHLNAIYVKLGVHDRLKLVVYAYRYGLVAPVR